MTAVLEVLLEEHQTILRLLRALEHQIAVFAHEGAPDYDVVVGAAEYFLDFPDRCHHPKEDAVFGRLRDLHPAEAAAAGDLIVEHEALHERAQRFRETVRRLLNDTDIARDVIVAAAQDFIMAKRRHLSLEERRFLPLAEALLTPEDWTAIEGELTRRPDPLFRETEATFRSLSDRLLAWEAEDEAEP